MIINLTQHPSSAEQREGGVRDLQGSQLSALKAALTFDHLPTADEIEGRAEIIADLAASQAASEAMIGGALWLMGPLERALKARGVRPLYAFSVRETVEERQGDGSTRKVTIFRHRGFVEAVS